jgi:hypothetical protein
MSNILSLVKYLRVRQEPTLNVTLEEHQTACQGQTLQAYGSRAHFSKIFCLFCS